MAKKTLIGILFILTLASTIAIFNPASPAVAMVPVKLMIYAGPPSVPADNNIYGCIFVQLQDSNSRPARAREDTIISLSSSPSSVGAVVPTITISKGDTYAVAGFNTSFTPGTTTITATASGYGTVQTNLVTIAPVPSRIALYEFPSVLPSDGFPYYALVVQLQDSSGNPAKAPLGGIVVTLTSSNSSIASVPASASISGGQTFTLASVISNAPGSAVITGQSSGYTSTQATFTTQQPSATQPKSLRITVAPPKNLADNSVHSQIAVQLLSASGLITRQFDTPITIQLTSSSENVGKVQSSLEIPAGQVYATATFSATYKTGATTITAAANDLATDTNTITTIGPIPTKLAVYCNPSTLPADNKEYSVIQVQLQDASGNPALDPNGDVTVSLFSSVPTVGIVQTALTIPYGSTYATAKFTSTYVASSTTITAQASGYTTAQAQMGTFLIDQSSLSVTLIADPTSVASGQQTNITAYVADRVNPTTNATIQFSSSGGGTFAPVQSLGNGYYTSMFTAPNFNASIGVTITATVTKTDYATSTATTQITVSQLTKYGTLQITVKDDAGMPVSSAVVYTSSQPSTMTNLTATTDSTGNVSFANVAEGNYTFLVSKQGYLPMNATLTFKSDGTVKTLYLTKIANTSENQAGDLTFVYLIVGAVVVIIVVAVLFMISRRMEVQLSFQNSGSAPT